MGVTRIDTPAAATALAGRLNARHRQRPVVLVSTSAATNEAWIDVNEIDSELGNLADVYLSETGEPTWALSRRIPPKTEAYGGAGRVYLTDNGWVHDLHRSPLHFAFDPVSGRRATRSLISDAMRFANQAGVVQQSVSQAARSASGTVHGIPTPERALVKLDDQTWATVTQELTVPSVSIEDTLREGMRVDGRFDPVTGRLDISASVQPAADALAAYQPGTTVLARVEEVRRRSARLALYPGVEAWVRDGDVTSNELDDFRTLMTPREVVVAHVRSGGPDWRLQLADVDDDEEPVVAPVLIEGGRPWLEPPTFEIPITVPPPDPEPEAIAPKVPPEHPSIPTPAPSPGKALQGLSLKVAELQVQLAQAESRLVALQGERDMLAVQLTRANSDADELRRQAKQLRTEVRRRSRRPATEELGEQFSDPEEQLRFEIEHRPAHPRRGQEPTAPDLVHNRAGLHRIGPPTRRREPQEDRRRRRRGAQGLAKDLEGRQLHPLRTSEAGDASPAVHPSDGAHAMRVNLQTNTPSARRLHYWQLKEGSVELAKVVLHDDFTI